MKPILIFLVAIALILTAQMRESVEPDTINPSDELINRELIEQSAAGQE